MAEILSGLIDHPTYSLCDDSTSVEPPPAAKRSPGGCRQKSKEFGAARIIKSSAKGSKTLLTGVIGVGGDNDPDDIEEPDIDGEADLPPRNRRYCHRPNRRHPSRHRRHQSANWHCTHTHWKSTLQIGQHSLLASGMENAREEVQCARI